MNEFKKYRNKGYREMRQCVFGESMEGISVSDVDKQLMKDLPNIFAQGFIARNPENHADLWYVAKDYFDKNLELFTTLAAHLAQKLTALEILRNRYTEIDINAFKEHNIYDLLIELISAGQNSVTVAAPLVGGENGIIDVMIDRTTLPKDGQYIDFQTENEEWHIGYFVEGDDLFWVNDSIWFPKWDVHKWQAK